MKLTKDNLSYSEIIERLGASPLHKNEKTIIHEPTYEIMSEKEMDEHYDFCQKEIIDINRPHGVWFFIEPFSLLDILKIKDINHANLISGFHHGLLSSETDDHYTTVYLEEDYIPKKFKINTDKNFIIIIKDRIYPSIKVSIQPIEIQYGTKTSRYFTIGYLLWQTVKVIKDASLYHSEKVDIGNIWNYLVPSALQLYKSNFGTIEFDS